MKNAPLTALDNLARLLMGQRNTAQRGGERWRRTRDHRISERARPAAIRSTEKLDRVMVFLIGEIQGFLLS